MPQSEIVLIAALSEPNRVIGKDNRLPWHIPEDLRRFKRLTSGHPLVMGRRTFESMIEHYGSPLPNRHHVVLTRSTELPDFRDVTVCHSIPEAMGILDDEPIIYIGGGQVVYEKFLPAADRLELTLIEQRHDGDTYFPEYEHLVGWAFERTKIDARDGFRFETFERKKK